MYIQGNEALGVVLTIMEFADPSGELLAILSADRPWRPIKQVLLKVMTANLQGSTAQRIFGACETKRASPCTDSADREQRIGI